MERASRRGRHTGRRSTPARVGQRASVLPGEHEERGKMVPLRLVVRRVQAQHLDYGFPVNGHDGVITCMRSAVPDGRREDGKVGIDRSKAGTKVRTVMCCE